LRVENFQSALLDSRNSACSDQRTIENTIQTREFTLSKFFSQAGSAKRAAKAKSLSLARIGPSVIRLRRGSHAHPGSAQVADFISAMAMRRS
jgi:hypothetical protein